MGFTVAHQGGTKDAEYQAYARLLRQSGLDLGHLRRVPEPGTKRRWLHVWDTEVEAQKFADELRRRTRDNAWEVVPTSAPMSEGPLGSILIQLARRGDGLILALHPLSLAMLRSAFRDSAPAVTTTFINTEQWLDFRRTQGGIQQLVAQVLPGLTGLTSDQLQELGYVVLDSATEDTLVFVPPAPLVQV